MYNILSRFKTNGSYTDAPKMDSTISNYGNKIELIEFEDIELCVKWIFENGDKSRIYYIVSKYMPSCDKNFINNSKFDVGSDYFVRRRYTYTSGNWLRIQITSSKSHNDYYRKQKYRIGGY